MFELGEVDGIRMLYWGVICGRKTYHCIIYPIISIYSIDGPSENTITTFPSKIVGQPIVL